MKHDVMPSIVQMEPKQLRNLVREVKETVAMDIQLPQTTKPSFGIVDMWNIHRKAKSARNLFRG
jgi:hypothetical protein